MAVKKVRGEDIYTFDMNSKPDLIRLSYEFYEDEDYGNIKISPLGTRRKLKVIINDDGSIFVYLE